MTSLDRVTRRHSPPIAAILEARFARWTARPLPPLEDVLPRYEYPVTDAVVAFDEAYGGLEVLGAPTGFDGEPAGPTWSFDDAYGWMIGAARCVASQTHRTPRGDEDFLDFYGDTLGLVPVAFGPQDDIWYLDRVGRGYFHDTCYDVGGPHLVAQTPRLLFARMVLSLWCLSRCGGVADGFHGERLAQELDLEPLEDATDATARWWGRGTTVVGETISLPGEGYPIRPIQWFGAADKATADGIAAKIAAWTRSD